MADSFLADRQVLYFIRSSTCEACKVAEPEFVAFERKHPTVMTLKLDAEGPLPERLGLKVKATPTYAYRRGNEAVMIAGAMKVRDIESWLKKLGATL
jgi:hypothetical protein